MVYYQLTEPKYEDKSGMQSNTFNIAVIPGDGIGKEVMPEGLRVLEAAAERFNFKLNYTHYDFACAEYYTAHGKMMPDDWKDQLGSADAIFFGAVGCPEVVPDHISLWDSLIKFRREFDQYVNLRPARAMPVCRCRWLGVAPVTST